MSGKASRFSLITDHQPVQSLKAQKSNYNTYSISKSTININSLWNYGNNIYRLWMEAGTMSEIAKIIGQRVRNYRIDKGLSQEACWVIRLPPYLYRASGTRGKERYSWKYWKDCFSYECLACSAFWEDRRKQRRQLSYEMLRAGRSKSKSEQEHLYKMLVEMDKYKNQ